MTHDMTNTRNWSPINSSVWSLVITRHLLPVSTLIGHPGLAQASDWLVVSSRVPSCPQPRLPITRCHNAHMSRHPVTHRTLPAYLNNVTCSTHYSQLTWLFISDRAAMNLTIHVSLVDFAGGQMLFLSAYNKQRWDNGTGECSNTPW